MSIVYTFRPMYWVYTHNLITRSSFFFFFWNCESPHTSKWRLMVHTFNGSYLICGLATDVEEEMPPSYHVNQFHDDVIKWKHFPRNWPFVQGIHRPRWPVTRSFHVFFDQRLNKRLSKQPWGWWFETPSLSLWRQCNTSNVMDAVGN